MISFQNVTKRFGTQTVLSGVSFRINPGERVGIVGPNGAGKSTIFSLVAGDMESDEGQVELPKGCRLGYVRQQLNPHEIEDSMLGYAEDAVPEIGRLHRQMEKLERSFEGSGDEERAAKLKELGELQTRFEQMRGYEVRHTAEAALSGLGFSEADLSCPFQSFSGGWQMRAALARALVARPQVLLLDEPSNYLDIPAVEWLQQFLREFDGTLVLISHDRFLLNSLTTRTLEVANAVVTGYPGNYDTYVEQREQRYQLAVASRKNQDRQRQQMQRFVDRFRAKNTKASQVQSYIKRIERMDEVLIPLPPMSRGRLRLHAPPPCGVEVMRLEDAGYTYDGERWVLRHLDLRIEKGQKIALVGPNGTGKTTLLRLLSGVMSPAEGKRFDGHRTVTGYQSQDFAETVRPEWTVFEAVKGGADATDLEVRTLLGGFGFSGDAVEKRVSVLSGGEQVRLAFARLLIRPPNFLVLDEPTTHLDVTARETLQDALEDYTGTLCVVSHDIEFVRHVATSIIEMRPPGVRRYPGGYDYYRDKRAADAALESPEPVKTEAPARGRRATRQDRAKALRDLAERARRLKDRVRTLERRLHALEEEQGALAAQLADPSAEHDYEQTNRRLSTIMELMERTTVDWEDAATLLERLEQERRAARGARSGAG